VPKALIVTAGKIGLSAALLFWILRNLDISTILLHLKGANWFWLGIAFAMFFLGYLITALRWRMLLRAQGISAPLGFLIKSFMVGIFFNNLLPSTIGGDAVRVYDSWRLGNSKSRATSVVMVDRLMGLVALAIYCLATVLFAGELIQSIAVLPWLVMSAAVTLAAIAWGIFLAPQPFFLELENRSIALSPSLGRIVHKIGYALSPFRGKRSLLLRAFGLSLVLQMNVIIHFIIVTRALGIDVPPVAMFTIIPLSIFVMMLPITINGIGLREGIFVLFFAAYGVPTSAAVALAWVALGFIIIQGLLGGLVFLSRRESRFQPGT